MTADATIRVLEEQLAGKVSSDRHEDLLFRVAAMEQHYVRKEELKHYISVWKFLLIMAAMAPVYTYITPRVIALETSPIIQKLDHIIDRLDRLKPR